MGIPSAPPDWLDRDPVTVRREAHFGRVLTCLHPRPATFHEMISKAMTTAGDAPALICPEEGVISHAALLSRVAQVAGGLLGAGLAPGDRVAAQLGNRAAFVELWLACLHAGLVFVPMNPRWRAREVAYVVNDCAARVLVAEATLAPELPLPQGTPSVQLRALVDDDAPLFPTAAAAPASPAGEDDTAVILYTSGTTGAPKGAMITHLNLVHSAMNFHRGMEIGAEDVTMLSVPASHVTGMVANLATLLSAGGAVVMMRAFKAEAYLRLAAEHRATHSLMVPAMYNLCLREPSIQALDLSAWRLGGYGGAPMPPATIAALARVLPALCLQQAYGATETCSPATIMPSGDTAMHPSSVGLPVHCCQITVMDERGVEAPAGESGELWISGPMVVPGYWGNAEATAREFAGGFWKSGDIGSIDADGYVHILDRKKDMINRGGYKVYSVEVEHTLARHPAVVEAAVVGYPCDVLGERVRAHVHLSDATTAAFDSLRAHAEAELADYKRPDAWVVEADPLPRNPNGKVIKSALRERA